MYINVSAVAYGNGAYFARDASYSAKYSQHNSNGPYQMYRAKVLTGEYIKGDSSMRTPPSKNGPNNAHLLYDTTVDNVDEPTIFVTYCDTQAYPEYLVTFQ